MTVHPELPVSPNKAKLSVIFSFYNEEKNLPEALTRLPQILKAEIAAGHLGDYELIFVNDASKDGSREILTKAAHKDEHDTCALAGMERCSGDLVVYLDADLQDPPELLPEMLKVWREKNTDVLHTVRTSREGESRIKMLITRIGYSILRKFSRVQLESNCGDFKLITRRALNEILAFREKNPFFRGIATFVGFNQDKIYYVRKPRFAGETSMPVFSYRVISYFLDSALISFSDVPLKLVSLAGILCSITSVPVGIYVLIEKYRGNTVPGWSGIVITILFIGGIQLLSMGVLGLYINSIFLEVKKRPNFISESTINL